MVQRHRSWALILMHSHNFYMSQPCPQTEPQNLHIHCFVVLLWCKIWIQAWILLDSHDLYKGSPKSIIKSHTSWLLYRSEQLRFVHQGIWRSLLDLAILVTNEPCLMPLTWLTQQGVRGWRQCCWSLVPHQYKICFQYKNCFLWFKTMDIDEMCYFTLDLWCPYKNNDGP